MAQDIYGKKKQLIIRPLTTDLDVLSKQRGYANIVTGAAVDSPTVGPNEAWYIHSITASNDTRGGTFHGVVNLPNETATFPSTALQTAGGAGLYVLLEKGIVLPPNAVYRVNNENWVAGDDVRINIVYSLVELKGD